MSGSLEGSPARRARRYGAVVLAYLVAIVIAVLVVPLTNGSFTQLTELRFSRAWLLGLGLVLQIGLDVVDLPRARYEDLGLAVLLVSYVALLAFCVSNIGTRGMLLIGIGIALNAVVIALNAGMPYKVADGIERETSVKHRPTRSDDIAVFLSDQITVGGPVDAAISAGDIVLAIGIVELTYAGSRRVRRRGSGLHGAGTRSVLDLTTAEEVDVRGTQPTGAATRRSRASSTRVS